MLTVRVLPLRGAAWRSALATLEVMVVLVAAHTAAGGTLPSIPWIAGTAAGVFVAGSTVFTRRLSIRVAAPALVVLQILLHECLVMAGPAHAPEATHAMTHGSSVSSVHTFGSISWPMLVAHMIGALATAAIWELRARATEVVATWTDLGLPALPCPRCRHRTADRAWRSSALEALLAAPRRGPPAGLPAFV